MSSQAEPGLCRTTIWDTATATTGTFRWTINDFKDRPEKCTEKLRSLCFNVKGQGDLGTKWQLVIYPKGKGKEDASEDYVDMTLYNKSQVEVTAEFKYESSALGLKGSLSRAPPAANSRHQDLVLLGG